MRQTHLQEFFPRRFALPFREAAAFAVRIRNDHARQFRPPLYRIRLMLARNASVPVVSGANQDFILGLKNKGFRNLVSVRSAWLLRLRSIGS
jgi:hypothetical protein